MTRNRKAAQAEKTSDQEAVGKTPADVAPEAHAEQAPDLEAVGQTSADVAAEAQVVTGDDAASAAPEVIEVQGTDLAADVASKADMIRVTCLIKAGRRRAGRRWQGGATDVLAESLTTDDLAELDADPLFLIRPISATSDE